MNISEMLLIYGAMVNSVFAVTEALRNRGPFRRIPNRWLAVGLGVAFSVAFTATGFVDLPGVEGAAELITAALGGVLVFGGAHMVHESAKLKASRGG